MIGRRARSGASVELAVRASAEVGEGPLWCDAAGELVWVDLAQGELHRSDPRSGADAVVRVGTMLGAVAPRASGGFVAAVADGFAYLAPDGAPTLSHPVAAGDDQRMNDAKCDPAGRLWGGLVPAQAGADRGELYVWAGGDGVKVVWNGLSFPNGLGWSPDGRTFYLADSEAGVVFSAPFEPACGSLGERRVLLRFAASDGVPDGLCVDADGCLWVALWGGREVRRYTAQGELLTTIRVPVTQPSSCAIAPDGLLYVTSARAGLTRAQLAGEPLAGSVFAFDAGVPPVPMARFAG